MSNRDRTMCSMHRFHSIRFLFSLFLCWAIVVKCCHGLISTEVLSPCRGSSIRRNHGHARGLERLHLRGPTLLHISVNPFQENRQTHSSDDDLRKQPFANDNNNRKSNNYYYSKLKSRKTKIGKKRREDVWTSGRWNRAEEVEGRLRTAMEALQQSVKLNDDRQRTIASSYCNLLSFPDIRECNAALATFGDGGDLLRALRLFVKMRKVLHLSQRFKAINGIFPPPVPSPTLVSYSTLMSRALYLGKPLVALRLWKLMRSQAEFFSNYDSSTTITSTSSHSEMNVTTNPYSSSPSSFPHTVIVPDVKAANILMNSYAKLGNVEMARNVLDQMRSGSGPDLPRLTPNLVTYNTLLDACHKAGDLDAALEVKEQLGSIAGMRADARTYTTLIATVARKSSLASGAYDPTLAFSFLQEMVDNHVRPNGMTYSALIDVCGRCGRFDLALKGLRTMLDQKAQEEKEANWTSSTVTTGKGNIGNNGAVAKGHYTLSSEVGAWTAAINACGKAGRIETAIKLFYAMPKFGVEPNKVTCGCMMDCLFKAGKTAETLDLLRYMKKHGIAPSKFMYTSLMTSAGRLVEFERNGQLAKMTDVRSIASISTSNTQRTIDGHESFVVDESGATKAIEVYTELIKSLIQTSSSRQRNERHQSHDRPEQHSKRTKTQQEQESWASRSRLHSNELLFNVFLVFQEMKAVGAQPDLACYNALLKTCANAGDVKRAQEVLEEIKKAKDVVPNDLSWREMIRAAGVAGRTDIVMSTWKDALVYHEQYVDRPMRTTSQWQPSVESLSILATTLVRSASNEDADQHTSRGLLRLVVKLYKGIISSTDEGNGTNQDVTSNQVHHPWGMHLIDKKEFLERPRALLAFLEAIVTLEKDLASKKELQRGRQLEIEQLREVGVQIVTLPCFKDGLPTKFRKHYTAREVYGAARSWSLTF